MISLPGGLTLPDAPTEDDVDTVLASIPGLSWDRAAWADFRLCPPDVQKRNLVVLAASSENPGPDTMGEVLNVLKVIVVVAGGVAGIAGAISGIEAIKW